MAFFRFLSGSLAVLLPGEVILDIGLARQLDFLVEPLESHLVVQRFAQLGQLKFPFDIQFVDNQLASRIPVFLVLFIKRGKFLHFFLPDQLFLVVFLQQGCHLVLVVNRVSMLGP